MSIETTTKCPVCENLAKLEYENDDVRILEEYIRCDCCGYAYDFAYGSYREIVNSKEFIYDYTIIDDNTKMRRLFKKIDKEKFMARRNWRKDITKRKKAKIVNQ